MRIAQRGKRRQGKSTEPAHTTKTARLAQYKLRLLGPGGSATLAWATAASPMKMDARTKNRRRPRIGPRLTSVLFHGVPR